MTKVIAAIIIILVLYGGWELWLYWDNVSHDRDLAAKQAVASQVREEQLPGMPSGLESSYQAAKKGGNVAWKNWLKKYGQMVQDPRRAWIELDYMISIAREEPPEAKRIFAEVKSRVPEGSPVYNRVKELEKTYQ